MISEVCGRNTWKLRPGTAMDIFLLPYAVAAVNSFVIYAENIYHYKFGSLRPALSSTCSGLGALWVWQVG